MTQKKEMDRVCGMWIEKSTASFTSQYHGETYYFCAKECKQQFDQNPEFYRKGFEGRKPYYRPVGKTRRASFTKIR